MNTKERQVIKFYKVKDAYGAFSNFALYPIVHEGIRYSTTEHFFQQAKFKDLESKKKVIEASTPMEAATLGRTLSMTVTDWSLVRDKVMYLALLLKFTQHVELRELLLSTGDAEIVEETTDDHYWGKGSKGDGKNMLGVLLMKVRAVLSQV